MILFVQVIQRRYNGKVDFFRGLKEYEDGFGSIDKNFGWVSIIVTILPQRWRQYGPNIPTYLCHSDKDKHLITS